MFKRFLAGLLLLSTAFFCGCQTTLDNADSSVVDETGNTEDVATPSVPISTIIETAVFQYPAANNDFYYEVYDTYVAVTQYVGGNKEYVRVPDTIENKPVYVIADYTFKKTEIQAIDISKNVYLIGEEAFSECKQLRRVNFVDVTDAVEGATVGTGIAKIGKYAFNECDALVDIVLPDGVLTIGESAFYSCDNLKRINLPDTITTLGMSAFYDCISLRRVVIPPLVTYIPHAFCAGCISLTDVYIGTAVTEISSSAFNSVPTTVVFHGAIASVAAEYAASHYFGFSMAEEFETGGVGPVVKPATDVKQ